VRRLGVARRYEPALHPQDRANHPFGERRVEDPAGVADSDALRDLPDEPIDTGRERLDDAKEIRRLREQRAHGGPHRRRGHHDLDICQIVNPGGLALNHPQVDVRRERAEVRQLRQIRHAHDDLIGGCHRSTILAEPASREMLSSDCGPWPPLECPRELEIQLQDVRDTRKNERTVGVVDLFGR
jgi:hypothetical protein